MTLAVLALVAGYVWLGPALARWGGQESPGTTPEPTRAPETSGVPSDGGGGPPAATTDVTPECTQLEDGTVSCVVTP